MQLPPFPSVISRSSASNQEYLDYLNFYFTNTILPKDYQIFDKPVSLSWGKSTDEISDLLWHLVTGGFNQNINELQDSRAQRLSYIPYMLDFYETNPNEIHWYYRPRQKSRLIIFTRNGCNRYLCVLNETVQAFTLISAYPPSKKRMKKFIEEYDAAWKTKTAPPEW
ncbi:MAG TPA: hypothetical protein PL103_07500 [Saccharofermentans sp.]|nr:hypothetical protein [Saccharofermentans sp.]